MIGETIHLKFKNIINYKPGTLYLELDLRDCDGLVVHGVLNNINTGV